MERTKRHDSQYASSLIEASLDPLITINMNGKIMDLNQAKVEVTGVSREKLIGSNFIDFLTDPLKATLFSLEVF